MTTRHWLRKLFGFGSSRPTITRKQPRPRCRPRLEVLEDRLAPATLGVVQDLAVGGANETTTAGLSALSLPLSRIPTAGNAIIVEVATGRGANVAWVTDSAGNSYHQDLFASSFTAGQGQGSYEFIFVFSAMNVKNTFGLNPSITIHTLAAQIAGTVQEFAGLVGVDQKAAHSGGGVATSDPNRLTFNAGPVTTSENYEVALGVVGYTPFSFGASHVAQIEKAHIENPAETMLLLGIGEAVESVEDTDLRIQGTSVVLGPAGSPALSGNLTDDNAGWTVWTAGLVTYKTQSFVTLDPLPQYVNVGGTAIFTAASSNTAGLNSVQWQVDDGTDIAGFVDIPGATSTTLTVPNVSFNPFGSIYRAVFTEPSGRTFTTTLGTGALFVDHVTINPASQFVQVGQTATLTAASSNTFGTDTVQWQMLKAGSGGWTDIPSATSTTLNISVTAANQQIEFYRARFTSIAGPFYSTEAVLAVDATAVSVTDVLVNDGQTAALTASPDFTGPATAQWQVFNGTLFANVIDPSANTIVNNVSTLNINAAPAEDGKLFRVIFESASGSNVSDAYFRLHVDYTATLGDQSVYVGQTTTFTAASSNPSGTDTVQWQVDSGSGFTNIDRATSTTLTIAHVGAALTGNHYRAVFTNSLGSVTTRAALLRVADHLAITATPNTVVAGQSVTINGFADDQLGNVVFGVAPEFLTIATPFASGLHSPSFAAVDAQGNVFVADVDHISKFSPSGALLDGNLLAGTVYLPQGMAFDGQGNLWVVDNTSLYKLSPSGTLLYSSWGGFSYPAGLAIDAQGNIYVADNGANRVIKFSADGALVANGYISGLSGPWGLAFDDLGNLYVSATYSGTVSKYSATGALVNAAFVSGLTSPGGMAFDSQGNLYVADYSLQTISKFAAGGGLLDDNYAAGLSRPSGLAFDPQDNLYVVNSGDNTVTTVSDVTARWDQLSGELVKAGVTTITASLGAWHATAAVTVTAAAPSSINPVAGAEQTAFVGATYSIPLTVAVTDAFGNPVSGVAVLFTAPFTGASGTFPGNSANVFVYTDAAGLATAPPLVASLTAGSFQVTAAGALTTFFQLTNQALTPTITWPTPADITYGTALGSTQLNASASAVVSGSLVNVPGAFSYTYTYLDGNNYPALGVADLEPGPTQLQVSFTPSDSTEFTGATATTVINVVPATPTITWPTPADIPYGTALGSTQLNASASFVFNGSSVNVPGTFTYTLATSTPVNGAIPDSGFETETSDPFELGFFDSPTGGPWVFNGWFSGVENPTVAAASDNDRYHTPPAPEGGWVAFLEYAKSDYRSPSISQTVTLADGTYNISFSAGASRYYQALTVQVLVDDKIVGTVTPVAGNFTNFTTAGFSVTGGVHTIQFRPLSPSGGVAFIDDVKLQRPQAAEGAVLDAGQHQTLNVSFTPYQTTYFTRATATVAINVKATTSTLVTSSVPRSVSGERVTLTATVSGATPGSSGTPTGNVNFYDGSTLLGSGALVNGKASFSTAALTAGSHAIAAYYNGDNNFVASTAVPMFNSGVTAGGTVLPLYGTDPHFTIISAPAGYSGATEVLTSAAGFPIGPWLGDNSSSGWIVPAAAASAANAPAGVYDYRLTFDLTGLSPADVRLTGRWSADNSASMTLNGTQVLNTVNPNDAFLTWTPFTISNGFVQGVNTLDFIVTNDVQATGNPTGLRVEFFGGLIQQVNAVTAANLQAVLTETSTPTILVANNTQLQTLLTAVNGLTAPASPATITVNLAPGTYTGLTAHPPAGVTLVLKGTFINGTVLYATTIVGHSPALEVSGGEVIVSDILLTNDTDAPTVLVSGGSLTLRNTDIEESTGATQAAIAVTGGTVDLGTADDPGGNILNVNGTGELVHNTTANSVAATGNTFEVNAAVTSSNLSSTALASSNAATVYGQAVTLTATVQASSSDGGTPSGTVDFVDTTTNTDLGSVSVSDGSATLSISALAAGDHLIRATYSGDNSFTLSLDSLTQTVTPAPLPVLTNSSIMLVGTSPPALTGSVGSPGTPFTNTTTVTTAQGDTVTVTLSTSADSSSAAGQYAITASLSGPSAGNYAIMPVYGTMYVVTIGADPTSTIGAQAVAFWDNKDNRTLITAADLASLDVLNLVNNNGTAFDPNAAAALQSWMQKADWTNQLPSNANLSYVLSAQLAAMELNVLSGYVQTTDLVYAGGLVPYLTGYGLTGLTEDGFISVGNLMSAANAALALDPTAFSTDPNRAYVAALAVALQGANSNSSFVNLAALDALYAEGLLV